MSEYVRVNGESLQSLCVNKGHLKNCLCQSIESNARIDIDRWMLFVIVEGDCVSVSAWTTICFVQMHLMVAVIIQQLVVCQYLFIVNGDDETLTQVAARPDTPEPTTAIFMAGGECCSRDVGSTAMRRGDC